MAECGELDLLVQGRRVVDRGAAFGDFEGDGGFLGRWAGGERDVAALDHEVGDQAVERCVVVDAAGAEGEEVLRFLLAGRLGLRRQARERTSAVCGTASQNTSTLRSPCVVWSWWLFAMVSR